MSDSVSHGPATDNANRLHRLHVFEVLSLHRHSNSVAAAETKSGNSAFGLTSCHLIKQRNENPGAAGTDRMAQGDGASVDIHSIRRQFQLIHHGEGLDRKRLI